MSTVVEIGVVEDSDEDFVALERAVRRSGAEVVVERWQRAEDLLAQAHGSPRRTAWPQLLFIDLSLPGMDGIALIEQLRGTLETRPLPLFILSGSQRPKDVDRGYVAGASLYLTKPLDAAQVRAAIDLLGAAPPRRTSSGDGLD